MLATIRYYISTYSLLPLIVVALLFVCEALVATAKGRLKKETLIQFFKDSLLRFIGCFFVLFIFNATVFARIGKVHFEPFSDVLGGWTIIYYQYTTNYSCIFNIALFLPVFTCALDYLKRKEKAYSGNSLLCHTLLFSICISMSIELLQAVLKVGTFQLSDLVYNTLGGALGAGIYCLIFSLIGKMKKL